MNLSLMLNSVGFYQISKLSIIPTCCLFEALLNAKTFSTEVRASVIVVMIGVGVCNITDVSVKLTGFIWSCIAVVATTLQQIYVGSLQRKYGIGSFDLLSMTSPIQACCLIFAGPFCDYFLTNKNVVNYPFTWASSGCILLSCFLALLVNTSTYLCIGKFSAVSFQVLGHMKTLCVLILGWVFFDSGMTVKNIGGMVIAVIGMIMYSWAVEVDKKRASSAAAASPVAGTALVPAPIPLKSKEREEEAFLLTKQITDRNGGKV
eukprot:TRINITY_DN2283_c0_g1_i1.p1 TRINITY_DN2283_c0_g1~~TRINITY_DN2283_c0_g1_i1.p1  ORF type:complete len:262 (+),score=60.63 TRINITY_DN2283_c0_g1_i1:349-1134(+)